MTEDRKLPLPRVHMTEQDRANAWNAILARNAEVKRLAQAYADEAKPAAFLEVSGTTYLVSKDLNYPPDGWRVTMINDGVPTGHWEAKSAYDAFREVLAKKVTLVERQSKAPMKP